MEVESVILPLYPLFGFDHVRVERLMHVLVCSDDALVRSTHPATRETSALVTDPHERPFAKDHLWDSMVSYLRQSLSTSQTRVQERGAYNTPRRQRVLAGISCRRYR